MEYEFLIENDEAGVRIDKYLASVCPDLTRSHLQKLILEQAVFVNGKPVKSKYKTMVKDQITVVVPEAVPLAIEAEDLNLDIVYEDEDLLIVNKPKNMVVHPAPGHETGTLVNGLLYHCKADLSGINGIIRPGIVHRIDRNTTGLLVVCKNDTAHQSLAEQLKAHSIERTYHCIVHGIIKEDTGTVDAPIGRHQGDRKKMAVNRRNGREAVTHYRVLERFKNYSYIECRLETGRTHQIRVHMASIYHPILGDDVYCTLKNPFKLEGQTLHAKTLGFQHPKSQALIRFDSPLPQYFEELLLKLRNMR